ncbi:MAG: hypothetical protein QGM50_12250, partial [Anaerolineae bacterium]|nr:hypothetical protein [Anaerolineae bacterium]
SALALGDNVTCTITNEEIAPLLTVTKNVINDNGGSKVVDDFPLFVDGNSVTSGDQNTFPAGNYTVSETGAAGYTATIGGDCAADGSITLALGDVKSCTITNDDIPPIIPPFIPPIPPFSRFFPGIIPVTGGETHAIAAGIAHTCALTPIGGVQCWGDNIYGQLGDGTNTDSNVRVDVDGLQGGTTIVSGGNHTCMLTGGDVWCWGQNSTGQIGDGTTKNRNTPFKVLSEVIDITAGFDYTCAIMANGTVLCWGNNNSGQLADGGNTDQTSPTLAKLISGLSNIDAGRSKNCGVTPAGLIRCVSNATSEELGKLPEINLDVAVNRFFGSAVIAINEHNEAVQFLDGEPRVVAQLTSVQDIDSGYRHICALLKTGIVKCWGSNFFGQLGTNSKRSTTDPENVINLSGAQQLAVGGNHACVMTPSNDPEDSGIRCWGFNTNGQLGNGTNENSLVPVVVK